MEGFYVKKDDLRYVKNTTRRQIQKWQEELEEISGTLNALEGFSGFQGAAADAVKTYLKEIHGLLIESIKTALVYYDSVMTLYTDGYEEIDGNLHAVLKKELLTEAKKEYRNETERFDGLCGDLRSTIWSVQDLVYLYPPYACDVKSDFEEIISRMGGLISKVEGHENNTSGSSVPALAGAISATISYIRDNLAKAEDYPVNYKSGDFQYDTNIYNLAIALNETQDFFETNREKLEKAFENEQKVQEALLKEVAEKREDEGLTKVIVGTVTVVSCVGIIVVTVGAGAPVALTVTTGVFGGMGAAYGISETAEGAQDMVYGYMGDVTTVAFNPIRDTVFQGNQEAYAAWGEISTIVAGLCGAGVTGYVTAKVTGGKVALEIGKEIAKDQIVDAIGENAGEFAVDMADRDGTLKEWQKELIRTGTSKLTQKGIEKGTDLFNGKSFRDDMDMEDRKRYDKWQMEAQENLKNGNGDYPTGLSAEEIQRMRTGQTRLGEEQLWGSTAEVRAEIYHRENPVTIYGTPDIGKYEYNMIENPGPLAEGNRPAECFYGGRYNKEVLAEDRVYYRAGNADNPLGQWFTQKPPESVAKVRIDTAVKETWIDPRTGELLTDHASEINTVYAIQIPKGTTVYTGPVRNQGGAQCGGPDIMQTYIETPWKLDYRVISRDRLR